MCAACFASESNVILLSGDKRPYDCRGEGQASVCSLGRRRYAQAQVGCRDGFPSPAARVRSHRLAPLEPQRLLGRAAGFLASPAYGACGILEGRAVHQSETPLVSVEKPIPVPRRTPIARLGRARPSPCAPKTPSARLGRARPSPRAPKTPSARLGRARPSPCALLDSEAHPKGLNLFGVERRERSRLQIDNILSPHPRVDRAGGQADGVPVDGHSLEWSDALQR
eukprot:scaffold84408_cov33-Tisochrysis_lutea.AAC.11